MTESTARTNGTIYDIGYQHYTGPRLGRRNAIVTLAGHSFRAAFGRDRGARAQTIPFIMLALAYAPVFIQVVIASATNNPGMIRYEQQFQMVGTFLALFCAAQAPELVVSDRQYRVLSLYLARSLHATDYAFAKFFAFLGALLILTTGPELGLWAAKVLLAESPRQGFIDNYHSLAPIIGGTFVAAVYLCSVSLALASFTARRAYGSATVIAFFVLMPIASGIAGEILKGDARRWALLGNPFLLIGGFANWLFDVEASRRARGGRFAFRPDPLPGTAYLYVMLGTAVVATIVLILRYRASGRDA